MQIVSESDLQVYAIRHPRAAVSLEQWRVVTRLQSWGSFNEVRQTYRTADAVKTDSGRVVRIFSIAEGKFRLLTAINYESGTVLILDFLTHAEYDRQKWKAEF